MPIIQEFLIPISSNLVDEGWHNSCLSNISDTVSYFLARTLTGSGRKPRYIMLLLFQS
jgi:hypothetical protein